MHQQAALKFRRVNLVGTQEVWRRCRATCGIHSMCVCVRMCVCSCIQTCIAVREGQSPTKPQRSTLICFKQCAGEHMWLVKTLAWPFFQTMPSTRNTVRQPPTVPVTHSPAEQCVVRQNNCPKMPPFASKCEFFNCSKGETLPAMQTNSRTKPKLGPLAVK